MVFVHPCNPAYMGTVNAPDVGEWPFDTARAAIDLMYSGTVRRYPEVCFILAHAGGALPMILGRVELFAPFYTQDKAQMTGAELLAEVGDFYYDLAISARGNAIGALRAATSMEHVLFGCDWPFAWDAAMDTNISGFEALNLTAGERYALERGNATRLFPQLAGA